MYSLKKSDSRDQSLESEKNFTLKEWKISLFESENSLFKNENSLFKGEISIFSSEIVFTPKESELFTLLH